MAFPDHIFKAYDIRGLVDGELTRELAYNLGRAFVVFLREKSVKFESKKIVVGRDMRETSIIFQKEVIRGIQDEGLNVVDVGLVSTPLFNFACAHYDEHVGGIMVTASHNPAEYNGFKLTMGDGLPVGKNTGMDRMRELVQTGVFGENDIAGDVEQKDIFEDYKKKIFSIVSRDVIKPFKIVVDAGNGMAKVSLPKILKELPVKVEYLYLEPDGTFPNHEANPLKEETLRDLQKKVLENKADFGFALDGDADRVGLVDEKGQVVPASFVGGLVGLEILRQKPKSYMLYDLRISRAVVDMWEQAGAMTEMSMVGHANIKAMMKKTKAEFAAELSLHLYYRDMYDVECSDLSLLYILKILSKSNKSLSELWQEMNTRFHSGEINFEVEDKVGVLEKLKDKYSDAEINYLDGLLFTYEDYWFSARASNTEPVLRLNLEAKTKEIMEEKVGEVNKIIKEK